MGRLKRYFGWFLLLFGSVFITHTFISAPYSRIEVAAGYIVTGLTFAVLSIYVGSKWTKFEKVRGVE